MILLMMVPALLMKNFVSSFEECIQCNFLVAKHQDRGICSWCGISFTPDHSKRALCDIGKIPGNESRPHQHQAVMNPENQAAYQVFYCANMAWSEVMQQ